MEVMGAWRGHYDRAVFIDMRIGGSADAKRRAGAGRAALAGLSAAAAEASNLVGSPPDGAGAGRAG
jgi:hypothetical protein